MSAESKNLRSFGRRKGRNLRASKQELWDILLPKIILTLDAASALPNEKPIWLEIGFGCGEHLAHLARLHPEVQFIGCEPYMNGVAALLGHINDNKLNNILIFNDDARNLLDNLPENCLDMVFILYPDPWPKTRHNKRRILSTELLNSLDRVMKQNGQLRLATDHADYATWMLERLIAHPSFKWQAKTCNDWLNPPPEWVSTRYEQKALAGIPTYLSFTHNRPKCLA